MTDRPKDTLQTDAPGASNPAIDTIDSRDPVAVLQALIRCPSVTPAEGGALRLLEGLLARLGFTVERVVFATAGTPDVENLYARLGRDAPHLMFAGHTDVVPVGDAEAWTRDPFAGEIDGGTLYGRGAVDMKGGIAAFVAAVARHLQKADAAGRGSISLLITGDEEGPALNGTIRLLEWAAVKGERWDGAIVGEPTNPETLGDMIKIGRRGSLSGRVTIHGVQGHVAYPHLADNPVRTAVAMAAALMAPPLDAGNERFPATNCEVTTIDVGNPAVNVIPARAQFSFNVRFNDAWSVESLQAELHNRLDRAACANRAGRGPAAYDLHWNERPSDVFLTRDDRLIAAMSASVEAVTGSKPALSTTGGTSDARFIKDYCPVVEFGLVGQTMHMVDERVALSDLEGLTRIYGDFLARWMA